MNLYVETTQKCKDVKLQIKVKMNISSVHNNYNPTTRTLVQFNTKQIIEKYNFKCVNILIIVLFSLSVYIELLR